VYLAGYLEENLRREAGVKAQQAAKEALSFVAHDALVYRERKKILKGTKTEGIRI
jgi:hypothetical protein